MMDKSLFKEINFTEGSSRLSDYTVEEILCSYRNIPIGSVADDESINFVTPWHYYNTDEEFCDAVAKSETLQARLNYMKSVCLKDYNKIKELSKYFGEIEKLVESLGDEATFSNDTILDSIGSCITISFMETIANYKTVKYLTDIQNGTKSFNDTIFGIFKPEIIEQGETVLINNPFKDKSGMEVNSKSVVVSPGVNIPPFMEDRLPVVNLRHLVVPVLNAHVIANVFNISSLADVARELKRVMEEMGKWEQDT